MQKTHTALVSEFEQVSKRQKTCAISASDNISKVRKRLAAGPLQYLFIVLYDDFETLVFQSQILVFLTIVISFSLVFGALGFATCSPWRLKVILLTLLY